MILVGVTGVPEREVSLFRLLVCVSNELPSLTWSKLRDLRYYRTFKSSALWRCVAGRVREFGLLRPWKWRHYVPSKHRELVAQRQRVTSLKIWIIIKLGLLKSAGNHSMTAKNTVFYDMPPCSLVQYKCTNVSEEHATSILGAEVTSRKFFRNVD